MDRLSAAAAAAAVPPPSALPLSLPSTGPASRIGSAGTAHSSLPFSVRARPTSGLAVAGGVAGAVAGGVAAEDSASALPPLSSGDVEVLRLQWEASQREAIKAQVVSEMRSDKTVEYIRSLEAQIGRWVAVKGGSRVEGGAVGGICGEERGVCSLLLCRRHCHFLWTARLPPNAPHVR